MPTVPQGQREFPGGLHLLQYTQAVRVYLPHIPGQLRPEVPAKLDELGVRYELVPHAAKPNNVYPLLFCKWWDRGEEFAIIEQDNLIHEGVFPAWADCGHMVCGFPYTVGPGSPLWPWLGCTRFSAEIIKQFPTLAYDANEGKTPGWPNWHWKIMDLRVKQELARREVYIAEHEPPIVHLHYQHPDGTWLPEYASLASRHV